VGGDRGNLGGRHGRFLRDHIPVGAFVEQLVYELSLFLGDLRPHDAFGRWCRQEARISRKHSLMIVVRSPMSLLPSALKN
jgi:hypothetical protein